MAVNFVVCSPKKSKNPKSKDNIDEDFHSWHFCLLVILEVGGGRMKRA